MDEWLPAPLIKSYRLLKCGDLTDGLLKSEPVLIQVNKRLDVLNKV
jgi:hypothetical protein